MVVNTAFVVNFVYLNRLLHKLQFPIPLSNRKIHSVIKWIAYIRKNVNYFLEFSFIFLVS